ncbi:neuronal growth regulator 1 isoform X2 [Clarias magur]|uniref:Neuronal growth regulator 1 isoform X2 n=1 Tax=Clarias magur TaxID=1594786 RepID=A0A8J4TV24_CLAMG|nr:neuronal growth regulator 1 isoform X2 [Clarias magur]
MDLSVVLRHLYTSRGLSKGQAGIDIKNASSRSILTVSNITEDRYGNYTCVAVNKLGAANATVPLIREAALV